MKANISFLAAILSLTETPALTLLFLSPVAGHCCCSTWPTHSSPSSPPCTHLGCLCQVITDKASVTLLCWSLCDNSRVTQPAQRRPSLHLWGPSQNGPSGMASTRQPKGCSHCSETRTSAFGLLCPHQLGKEKALWYQDEWAANAFKIISVCTVL